MQPKVDRAVRLGYCVPYSQLTTRARLSAVPADNDSILSALIATQSLDRSGEESLAPEEWLAASASIEPLVRNWHGDARADGFHARIPQFVLEHGWTAALWYDIQEREMHATSYPTIDPSTPILARMQSISANLTRRRTEDLVQSLLRSTNARAALPLHCAPSQASTTARPASDLDRRVEPGRRGTGRRSHSASLASTGTSLHHRLPATLALIQKWLQLGFWVTHDEAATRVCMGRSSTL